ncbi:MAG: hypothetical protein J1E60_03135 [Christensenellaceae bacterium]|nr:hypothetical protein [Christensenellaceae bacterium]
MKLTKNMELINNSYRTLHERAVNLAKLLDKLGYSVEWGYYGQHSAKVDGEYYLEYYPIPVITVKDICDIGLDFSQVFVEGKLYPDDAQKLSIAALKGYEFEIYGIENYLADLYFDNMSDDELHESIRESGEAEVGLSILLDGEPLTKEILDIIKLLEKIGTHIASEVDEESDAVEGTSIFDDMDLNTPAFEIADALDND